MNPGNPGNSGPSGTGRGLGHATAVGVAWLLMQTVGTRTVGFVAQIVVASILFPEDFGLISLAYTICNLGSVLAGFGLEQVVIQRHRSIRFWVVPAFYLSLGLGIGVCLVLLMAAPVCATLYGEPRVSGLVDVIAFSVPFSALGLVPAMLLRARLDFRRIAALNFGEAVAVQVLTIAFAWTGLGAYSFALPLPIVAIGKSAALWLIAPARLDGTWRKVRRGRHLLGSGLAVSLANIILTLINNGDYFVLGLFGTTTAVGNYFFAFKLASQPVLLMAANFSNALVPALSQMRTERRAQGEAALKAARLTGLITLPLAVMQAAVIAPVIHLLFRDKWDNAIPLMQLLSVALGFDSIAWVALTLLVAQRGFWKHLVYCAVLLPVFFACVTAGGLHGSAMGVAVGVAVYYVAITPIYTYVVFRASGMTAGRLGSLYLVPAALAFCASAGGIATFALLRVQSEVVQVAVTAGAGALYYVALVWLMDRASFRDLHALAARMLSSRGIRRPA